MRILGIAVIAMLFVLMQACGSGNGQGDPPGEAYAPFDSEFLLAYAEQMEKSREHAGKVTARYVLDHVRNMEALLAEGRSRSFHEMPLFQQAVHQFSAQLLLRAMQEDLVPEIPRHSITDEEVAEFFRDNSQVYRLPDLYRVTLLGAAEGQESLLRDAVLRGDLEEGTKGELKGVTRQSLDPRPLDRFPSSWMAIIEELEPGESDILPDSEEGFVALTLESVERDRFQDLEERREYIRNDLLYSRYRQAWQEVYEGLAERHQVAIDPRVEETFRESFESRRPAAAVDDGE